MHRTPRRPPRPAAWLTGEEACLAAPSAPRSTEQEASMRLSRPGDRFRAGIAVLGLCLLGSLAPAPFASAASAGEDGTVEKMIVASGRVALDLDLRQVREANAPAARQASSRLRFDAEKDAFLT